MQPTFFATANDFRKWLEKYSKMEKELIVGYYKVNSGKPSLTWSQSVDEALCFGWIDGIRKSIDDESYCIRFTPRKPTSKWSEVNIKKVKELKKKGLMKPEGLLLFDKRNKEISRAYSYENGAKLFSEKFEKKFLKSKKAWAFFTNQAPSYKKMMIYWIVSAKQEETQLRRLNKLIELSGNQIKFGDEFNKRKTKD